MDRVERIGPRSPQWVPPALDPDRDVLAERRRRRDDERRRRRDPESVEHPSSLDDDPPHHIDVRA